MHALGSIEVVGLVAGIEAADVACKTADIDLIGYELTKGGGYVTVKVEGQVAAVQAAMAAAETAVAKLTRVVSRIVIPRPHPELETLVFSAATVGLDTPAAVPEAEPELPIAETPEAESAVKPAAAAKAPAKTQAKPKSDSGNRAKPGPAPQAESAKPETGQQPAPGPDPAPGAAPKKSTESTSAPRTSTRRKQS